MPSDRSVTACNGAIRPIDNRICVGQNKSPHSVGTSRRERIYRVESGSITLPTAEEVKRLKSFDTLSKIGSKTRFCRTHATDHETNLAFSGIRRDNFLTIFLIKVYLYDNIFTII